MYGNALGRSIRPCFTISLFVMVVVGETLSPNAFEFVLYLGYITTHGVLFSQPQSLFSAWPVLVHTKINIRINLII